MSLERELANANSFHVSKHTGQSVAKISRPKSAVTDSRSSDIGTTLGRHGVALGVIGGHRTMLGGIEHRQSQ